jgi:hypothetical protein
MDPTQRAKYVRAEPNGSSTNAHRGCGQLPPTLPTQQRTHYSEPIAVIGIALKFPQDATDTEAFWKLLLAKQSALSKVHRERYNADTFVSSETW